MFSSYLHLQYGPTALKLELSVKKRCLEEMIVRSKPWEIHDTDPPIQTKSYILLNYFFTLVLLYAISAWTLRLCAIFDHSESSKYRSNCLVFGVLT
jgi:hypothetical protein